MFFSLPFSLPSPLFKSKIFNKYINRENTYWHEGECLEKTQRFSVKGQFFRYVFLKWVKHSKDTKTMTKKQKKTIENHSYSHNCKWYPLQKSYISTHCTHIHIFAVTFILKVSHIVHIFLIFSLEVFKNISLDIKHALKIVLNNFYCNISCLFNKISITILYLLIAPEILLF